jgi:hypothetical protein
MPENPKNEPNKKHAAGQGQGQSAVMEPTLSVHSSKDSKSVLRFEGYYQKKNAAAFVAILLLSVLGFLSAAILVVEGVFALSGVGEELIRKDDPVLGFRHRANKVVTWRREGFSKSAFTSDGLFEDITPGAHPGIYRVAFFGDSMVEGLQEPQEQGFVKLLEKQLQGEVPGKLQIMNCGVFGYSTVQACLYADEVINKYKPDLVIYGYDTRDMAESIESWVPAGKSYGGRPYAIKKPTGEFEVSSEPVVNALQQEKSKFWAQFDWFQQHSRIWGYLTENRPKLSLHNALVDAVLSIGKPADEQKKPSFSIKFFEQNKAAAKDTSKLATDRAQALNQMTAQEKMQRNGYLAILDGTFGELVKRLNARCASGNAKLIVFALPSRSDLLPDVAAAPPLYGVNFDDELQFVKKHCQEQKIPFVDCHENARALNCDEQRKLFFVLHLTPEGHAFITKQLNPMLREFLRANAGLKSCGLNNQQI